MANGAIESPSFQERLAPKKRTITSTRISGIKIPTIPWVIATELVTCWKNTSQVEPFASSCAVMSARFKPLPTPTTTGVPTAPNDTGVDWIIIPTTTAARAGKPSATISGAATAAGVPKPDAPSMKQPNSQATISACTRRSGLMPEKPLRMAVIPPECFSVLSSKIAPKIIHSRPAVWMRPCTVDAATRLNDISHAVRPIMAAVRKTIGIAILAGILKPMSKIPASNSGRNASRASIVSFMGGTAPCY